jgi:hypothetical protein
MIDNFVLHGGSTCTDDIGWEFSVYSPTTVGRVTIRDNTFSWSNSTKQVGFNANSRYSTVENNTFRIGHSARAWNILLATGYASWYAKSAFVTGNSIIDPAHHIQVVRVGGVKGDTQPVWNDLGGTTMDGSVKWQDTGIGYISQIFGENTIIDTTNLPGTYRGASLIYNGSLPNGTRNNIVFTNNTIYMNGLTVSARNLGEFSHNHLYWFTTGAELPGSTVIVDVQGSQNIHDNDYHTNLIESGKLLQTYYDGGFIIPIVSNEHFLAPAFFGAKCGYCSGIDVVSRASEDGKL